MGNRMRRRASPSVVVASLLAVIAVELSVLYLVFDAGPAHGGVPAAHEVTTPVPPKRPDVAALLGSTHGATRIPGLEEQPVFVNMADAHTGVGYEIGRFDGGSPAETTISPAADACHLWSPSVLRGRNEVWLYAAEHDCSGWHRVVLFRSHDGGRTFMRQGIVFSTRDQLRMPTVVRDGGRFHLWYTLDRGGLGRALGYADSDDGLRFVDRGVKRWAGDLNALAVTYAFRTGRQWRLLVAGYGEGLRTAEPYVFGFDDPRGAYRLLGKARIERVAPKLDLSLVCRDAGGGWRGVVTAYGKTGELWGYEWTVAYRAPTLLGPWRPDAQARTPFLPLFHGGPKTSVENPEIPRASADVLACGRAADS